MLFAAFNTSSTGVQAASTYLDVVGNNVANSSTPGYKTSQINFQDLLYNGLLPGASTAGETPPGATQLGTGAVTSSITGLFTQGTLNPTGRPLDLGINGQGFFQIQLPDGTIGYTRTGDFTVDAAGQLTTPEGFLVSPAIKVPGDATSVSVGADGTVTAATPSGTQTLGQLTLTRFPNPGGLVRVGDTSFAAAPGAGQPTTATPGTQGIGTIQSGSLEQSNVDLSTELVNLIVAQRTFQYNTEALSAENQMLATTAALIT